MILLGNGGIPTVFRYKLPEFSGKRRAKSQIGDSCGNSQFFTATGGRSTPKFEDVFSAPTEYSVLDLGSVSVTYNSEKLLTVVVNTSTWGTGGWFGLCSSIVDALTTSATTWM